ncbi:MAG: AraC family transcriptional regulator [Siphonobacter sp.]
MKPLLFRVPQVGQRSFRLQKDEGSVFYGQLHFHPELQLTLVEKGEGTLIVGDRIDRFQPGDLLLLGSNVPHVLRSTPPYAGEEQIIRSVSHSMYFLPDIFEKHLFAFPEMTHLRELFQEARHGIRIPAQEHLLEGFEQLKGERPFKQALFLLEVLDEMVMNTRRQLLSHTAYERPSRPDDHRRLERIFSYLFQNYGNAISLAEIASVANLTPGAFCRFFKQHTRKNFSQLLNEVRIENACRLLRESNLPISQIAIVCGFTNMSNFNRQFKAIVNRSPSEYLHTYHL